MANALERLGFYMGGASGMVRHYLRCRVAGFRSHGSLEEAAEHTFETASGAGFPAGGHFPGLWPRDLYFASGGLERAGYGDGVSEALEDVLEVENGSFYTRFHGGSGFKVPTRGADTFPSLVLALQNVGELNKHAIEIEQLSEKFLDTFSTGEGAIIDGKGSSWLDSASYPRECYNTAMAAAAAEAMDDAGLSSRLTDVTGEMKNQLREEFWNGQYFDEHDSSRVFAADANFVPLYLGITDEEEAESIIEASERLVTPEGRKLREKSFRLTELKPMFWLHPDYHSATWPWSSFIFVNGALNYGMEEAASEEFERVTGVLEEHGNFLELFGANGQPYLKRGYASAEEFLAAAGLWKEARDRFSRP